MYENKNGLTQNFVAIMEIKNKTYLYQLHPFVVITLA
jgi:hypothetical protein